MLILLDRRPHARLSFFPGSSPCRTAPFHRRSQTICALAPSSVPLALWKTELPLCTTRRPRSWAELAPYLTSVSARPLLRLCRTRRRCARRSRKSPSSAITKQLSRDLVDVSEQVCRLRPVAETLSSQEKKNGRSDPPRSDARNRSTGTHHFQWPPPDGLFRSGSQSRWSVPLGHAPCRSRSAQ